MLRGECPCGAVAFEADHAPPGVFACHCSLCRRFTGAGGVAVVIVPDAAFRWLRGEACVTTWRKPDADWESHFCGGCGGALPGRNDSDHMFIPAGSLTQGAEGLRVLHHLFVGSKADWDEIGGDGKRHDGPYGP